MRSRPMRLLGIFTVLVVLLSWAFAFTAVFASDVDHLPGHDITIARDTCLTCHQRLLTAAPPMRHPATPTCGFCHLQGLPESR